VLDTRNKKEAQTDRTRIYDLVREKVNINESRSLLSDP
jgi:hypothetical protein